MIQKLLTIAGVFCLLCAVFPLFGFGIHNVGVGAIAIFGAAMILLPRLWHKIAAIKPLAATIIALSVVALVYFVVIFSLMINRAYFSEPPESGKATLIVLGGGIIGEEPSLMLRRRLNAAYRYMEKNPEATCIVSGGQAKDEIIPEALAMKKYLVSIGIAEEKIILEDKSENTLQNLKFSYKLLPQKDAAIIIVSDAFHQFRADMYAKNVGINSYALSSKTPWGLVPVYWLRETIAIPVAFFLTR